jgi:hypothetical protein
MISGAVLIPTGFSLEERGLDPIGLIGIEETEGEEVMRSPGTGAFHTENVLIQDATIPVGLTVPGRNRGPKR